MDRVTCGKEFGLAQGELVNHRTFFRRKTLIQTA